MLHAACINLFRVYVCKLNMNRDSRKRFCSLYGRHVRTHNTVHASRFDESKHAPNQSFHLIGNSISNAIFSFALRQNEIGSADKRDQMRHEWAISVQIHLNWMFSFYFRPFFSLFLLNFVIFAPPKNFGNRNLKKYDIYEWFRQQWNFRSLERAKKRLSEFHSIDSETNWPFLDTVTIAMANSWPHTPQEDHKWLAWAHNSRLIFGENKLYSSKFLDWKMERLCCTDYARIYFYEPHDWTI